jgi:hypothetical protein
MLRYGEIFGIASGESGRSCECHGVYGQHNDVGHLVKFKLVAIEVNVEEEEAIKAIKIRYDMECCHVGFLRPHFIHGR